MSMDDSDDDLGVDDNAIFSRILHSLGVTKYDPSVPTALADFARRYSTELLCDAKDYSARCGRNEIETEDIIFASKLSDHGLNRLEQQTRIMQNLAIEINAKSLIDMLPDENRKRKYNGDLLVRGHTYLPGHKAYSYKSNDSAPMEIDNDGKQANKARVHIQPLSGDKFGKIELKSRERRALTSNSEFMDS